MARLIHLSDLHFGAHEPRLVSAVAERIDEEKPDLVVISGDFTQRARTEQFKEACEFLDRLREAGHDVLAVPGNHDVPLYDDDAASAPVEAASGLPSGIMSEGYHTAKDRLVAHFEKEYLTRLVARAGGNMSKAARLASIDRTTLYRLMEKHGFRRDELSGVAD